MRNKRQVILLIVGTLLFGTFVLSRARKDYTEKQRRYGYDHYVLTETNIYKDTDSSSTVLTVLPENTKLRIRNREPEAYYQVIRAEGHSSANKGYIHKGRIKKIDNTSNQ